MFWTKKSQDEKDLSETTGGGFERPKPTFAEKTRDTIKAKVKEEWEFRKQLGAAKKGAYKKERLSQARRAGKTQAGGRVGKYKLSAEAMKAKPEVRHKSNIEKLMGL